jgi:hypothetical protein
MSSSTLASKQAGKTQRPKKARPLVFRREKEATVKPRRGRQYALNAVVGNLTFTRTSVTAWYTLAAQSVSFRPDSAVEAFIADGGSALAELVGKRLYVRVTTRPVSVRDIADRTWTDAAQSGGGPLPGADKMLIREQDRLIDADMSEKYVFVGVRVATSRRYASDPVREADHLVAELEKISQTMALPGLLGRPSTATELDLLLRRSFALSLPLPPPDTHVVGDWSQDDLPSLTSDVLITAEPGAQTCEVSNWDPAGNQQSSRVAVLTMGRIGALAVPQDGQGGWMHRSDRLPFPVEFMATIDVLPADKVEKRTFDAMNTINDQWIHYTVEHGKTPPRSLARQNELAAEIKDQIDLGLGGLSTRTDGWYRMAVWGATEQEVRDKVAVVRTLYGRQIEWWWSNGQYDLMREFMPGEPLANAAQRRCLPVSSVMAALPAATAQIGDNYGALVGASSGTSVKPLLWALWLDMERRNRSGLCIVTGGLGSGKSVLCGLVIYETVMLGSRWTIFDPSGQLGRLCDLPELAPYSRHVNLLNGHDGELNPYQVIADPQPENFHDTRRSDIENRNEWLDETAKTKAQRKALCKDVLTSLLPKDLRSSSAARSVLRDAVKGVPGDRTSSPNMVLDGLRRILTLTGADPSGITWTPEHKIAAKDVLDELEDFAATAKGHLIFGEGREEATGTDQRPLLTVYSLNGLRMPTIQELERGDESDDTRYSKALFNLASWLTQQSIYQGDRHERKGLMIDEAHMLTQFEEGASLIDKSSVDSRKHNCRFLLASQNVNHFNIDAIAPLASVVIVGRTTDPTAAAEALKLAGLAQDPAYVQMLAQLTREQARINPDELVQLNTPHEFLFSTKDLGTVERITVWGDTHPEAMAALNTTPGRVVAPTESEGVD